MKPFRLSRRAMLRGAGAALALPLLEAMVDSRGLVFSSAHADPQPLPTYLALFFWPNGVDLDMFLPQGTGAGYPLTECLAPLAEHEFVLLSNLEKSESWIGQDIDNDAHSRGHATFSTGHGLTATGVGGPSLDQVAADALWGGSTALKSLVCGIGSSDYFRGNVSWSAKDAPVPPIRSATALYDHLFPTVDATQTQARRSVLDYVKEDAKRMMGRVGKEDCARMDQFLTSVSEVETKLNAGAALCAKPAPPEDFPLNELTNMKSEVLLRLFVIAMQCDLTRFGVFQLASRWDARQYPWLSIANVDDGHHGISHDTTPAGRDSYKKIIIDQLKQFAFMLERMREVSLVEGTLLDHALAFTAPEHGSSWDDGHYFGAIPAILAGRAHGRLQGHGTHIRYEPKAKYSDLLLTMLHILGAPLPSFGLNGTKVLTEIFKTG